MKKSDPDVQYLNKKLKFVLQSLVLSPIKQAPFHAMQGFVTFELFIFRSLFRALALRPKSELRSSRAPAEFSELRSGSRSGRKIGVALLPALRPSGARAPGCAPTKVKIMNTHCSIKSGSTVYYNKEAQIMTQLFKTIVSSN